MNERQEKIISFLDKEGTWVKGKDIALVMHVSTRTIRSDMDAINTQYENGWIESSYQQGYRLCKKQKTAPQKKNDEIPQNPKERCEFILKKLLSVKEINITEVCEAVYASTYTVEADLKMIRLNMLEGTGLELNYKKGWISLTGEENAKRHLFKRLLMEEVEENFFNIDCIARLYPEFDLFKCKDLLIESMDQFHYEIRETEMPMLLMHIGIALKRMLQFNTIEDEMFSSEVLETVEYQVADTLYEKISHLYPIQVNEEEKKQLALQLLGRNAKSYTGNSLVIEGASYDLNELTRQMLVSIYDNFSIDMLEDEDLIGGLSLHLKGLYNRIQHHSSIRNVYLDEIRWKFPLIYDMAVCAAEKLNALTNLSVSQDEIGFLALHFGVSYNKTNPFGRYRALVIFPNDQALGKLVIQKIRSQFEERMTIIDVLSSFEEKKVKALAPDLILTTIAMTHHLDIPTVDISIFYTSQNEGAIFSTLNQLDKERGRKQFALQIKKLIQPEYFYESFKAESPSMVIEKICQPLIQDGYIPEEYPEATKRREMFASTSFEAGFALPHAFECDAKKSIISVAFLEKPIQWGDYSVDFVILLGIRQQDNELLRVFFDWWIQVISDSVRFSQLKRKKNYHAFMKALLEE